MSHLRSFDGMTALALSNETDNLLRLYISQFYSRSLAPSIGVEYHRFKMDQFINVSESYQYFGITDSLSRNAAVFGKLVFDNLNSSSFPTSGIRSSLVVKYRFYTKDDAHYIDPSFVDAPRNGDIMYTLNWYVTPRGGKFTFIPQLYHRSIICDGWINTCLVNIYGGLEQGRYVYQQMPFVGTTGTELTFYRNMSIARCDLRWNFTGKHYLTGMFNCLAAADSFRDYFSKENGISNLGVGLQYSYNSSIGPLSFDVHWSDVRSFGAYLSAGYYF